MIIILTFMSLALGVGVSASPSPGLLRVPRVYNALVTSNQNLSPSRAFPVIQPVVHTTAVGYVPPFYYAQFAPSYPGPEAGRLPQEFLPAEGGATPGKINEENPTRKEGENGGEEKAYFPKGGGKNIPRKDNNNNNNNGEDTPLSFYPNYHSLYYDPYLYSYNPFNAHLAQNPYLFDYQPQQDLAPALPPQGSFNNQHLLNPQIPDQGETENKSEEEKIPDVPPPPVPTSSSSSSSPSSGSNSAKKF